MSSLTAEAIREQIQRATEALILLLVVLSPWAFGSVHPFFRYCLSLGVTAILLLWAVELAITPFASSRKWFTPFQIPFLLLLLIGLVQLASWGALTPWIAPGTTLLLESFAPAAREVAAGGSAIPATAPSAFRAISFYPAETWRAWIWLLQLGLLFVRVQRLATVETLYRLSLACMLNGSLLAYFALVQFFSSEHGMLFWTFPSQGAAFGPFINRNHFAFYMNICFGFGLGLVAMRARAASSRSSRSSLPAPRSPLHDTAVWAIISSLVFMVVAIVISSSRGGLVSLLAAGAAVLVASLVRRRGMTGVTIAAIAISAALVMLTWLGFDFLESRYASLWSGEATQNERVEKWWQLLPLVLQFRYFGSGLGTLPYVEPMSRATGAMPEAIWEHAHNEYVQVAVEAGLLGFAAALLLITLLLRSGWKLATSASGGNAPLTWALLFAAVAIAMHSFFEFGLRIPAIAVLAVVLLGHVAGLRLNMLAPRRRKRRRGRERDVKPNGKHRHGPARATRAPLEFWPAVALRVVVPVVLLGSAVLIYRDARRSDLAERSRLAALRARAAEDTRTELTRFAEAARLAPDNARLAMELAQLSFAALDQKSDPRMLKQAQQAAVSARDLCPLLAEAHVLLGQRRETFQQADAKADYFSRARLARPADPTLALIAGAERLEAGDDAAALRHLHDALALSTRHLEDILELTTQRFPANQLEDQLFSNLPAGTLAIVADWLQMRDTFGVALPNRLRGQAVNALMDAKTAEDLYLRGMLRRKQGLTGEAQADYMAALRRMPENIRWRLELAAMLYDNRQLDEAARQLKRVLRQHPKNRRALNLFQAIAKEKSQA